MDTARSRDAMGQPSRAKGVYHFDAGGPGESTAVTLSDLVLQQERELTWVPPPKMKPKRDTSLEDRQQMLAVQPESPQRVERSPQERFAAMLQESSLRWRPVPSGPIVYAGGPSSDVDVYLEHKARLGNLRLPVLGAAATPAAPPPVNQGVSVRELIAAQLSAQQGGIEVTEALQRRIASTTHLRAAPSEVASVSQQNLTPPRSVPDRRHSQQSLHSSPSTIKTTATMTHAQLPLSHPSVTRQAAVVQRALAKSSARPQSLLAAPRFPEEASVLAAQRFSTPPRLDAKKVRHRVALPSPAGGGPVRGAHDPMTALLSSAGFGSSSTTVERDRPLDAEPHAERARSNSLAQLQLGKGVLRSTASFHSASSGDLPVIQAVTASSTPPATSDINPASGGGGRGSIKRTVTILHPATGSVAPAAQQQQQIEDAEANLLGMQVRAQGCRHVHRVQLYNASRHELLCAL
jgi:hypothetical protein